jgi:hypothetical protein
MVLRQFESKLRTDIFVVLYDDGWCTSTSSCYFYFVLNLANVIKMFLLCKCQCMYYCLLDLKSQMQYVLLFTWFEVTDAVCVLVYMIWSHRCSMCSPVYMIWSHRCSMSSSGSWFEVTDAVCVLLFTWFEVTDAVCVPLFTYAVCALLFTYAVCVLLFTWYEVTDAVCVLRHLPLPNTDHLNKLEIMSAAMWKCI